ncbi:MAG: hypothetical protein L0K86_04080 [Actinomycetia bacterium]|nr:hypothetical protein [Actinomycetes bacterium]
MSIAIIGTGISGLTLALRLQQLGVDSIIYADRTAAQHRTGRIPNLACRWADTLDRERRLDVAHWDGIAGLGQQTVTWEIAETGWRHVRRLRSPAQSLDFRVYLPTLLEDYCARGGRVVVTEVPAGPADLALLTADAELVVVAGGRGSVPQLFEERPDRAGFTEPRRLLVGGVFRGVTRPDPPGTIVHHVFDGGEIFEQVYLTDRGLATALLIEAVPDGPLVSLASTDPADAAFAPQFLAMARHYGLSVTGRIDARTFGLLGPLEGLRAAIRPLVRHAVATLPDGRTALAVGDAWVTWDPVVGKGANIGSHCAWLVADAIAASGSYTAAWARDVEETMWAHAQPIWDWAKEYLGAADAPAAAGG